MPVGTGKSLSIYRVSPKDLKMCVNRSRPVLLFAQLSLPLIVTKLSRANTLLKCISTWKFSSDSGSQSTGQAPYLIVGKSACKSRLNRSRLRFVVDTQCKSGKGESNVRLITHKRAVWDSAFALDCWHSWTKSNLYYIVVKFTKNTRWSRKTSK